MESSFVTPAVPAHARPLRVLLGDAMRRPGGRRGVSVPVGNVLTRLRIPKQGISLDVLVVEGTTPAALRAGAGHYVGTPLPGENGNVAIAGHRTTSGRPFNHLDELGPGDEVILDPPFASYHYPSTPSRQGPTGTPRGDHPPARPHKHAPPSKIIKPHQGTSRIGTVDPLGLVNNPESVG